MPIDSHAGGTVAIDPPLQGQIAQGSPVVTTRPEGRRSFSPRSARQEARGGIHSSLETEPMYQAAPLVT